jgi:hypothetical protein
MGTSTNQWYFNNLIDTLGKERTPIMVTKLLNEGAFTIG